MTLRIIVISVYALLIIGMGILGMRKTRTFSDYFLGGGKIGPWMTAFTYGTAYFSAVLFIGFAGDIGWKFGYSSLWITMGNTFIGVLGVWWFLGYRIKKMSVDYNVSTMPEYFEKRYNSKFLKIFSAICIFVFFIPYSAAVFSGLSYLFQTNFSIDYTFALTFMGVFTAVYLVLGGYKSMTMVDVFFGVIMVFGVVILLGSTIHSGGGLGNMTAELKAIDPRLASPVGPPGLWPLFCLVVLTSVAPLGMPQLVQKFYAIKDKKAIQVGMIASTFFALLVSGTAYFTGAATRLFLSPENTPDAFRDGQPIVDNIMPVFLGRVIPDSLSVILLLLILSASMSTLAALILISSSSIAKDIYAGFVNPNVTDKQLTLTMRVLSATFILMSIGFAYFEFDTIVAILGISWGAIGSVFLGPFIWGLFSKRVGSVGAITASVLALTVCTILYFTGTSSPEAGTIGMFISLITPPIVSIFFPNKHVY
jgi:solute:Na+ symporter, SSS family